MIAPDEQRTFYFYRGRVALCALLRGLELQPGDEVLLQAFTCLAVPCPILGLGLTPIYVDIGRSSFNMDLKQAETRITAKTKAIILQHTFGIPADLDAAQALARKHGLALIEDCCHVLSSRHRGQQVGSTGDAAFFSYEWGKPVVIGVGGVAVIHSQELRDRVRIIAKEFVPPRFLNVAVVNLQYAAHQWLRRPRLYWLLRSLYRSLDKRGHLVGSFRPEEFRGSLSHEYDWKMPTSFQKRLSLKAVTVAKTLAHRQWLTAEYDRRLRQLGAEGVPRPGDSETILLRSPFLALNKAEMLREARKWNVELGDWFASPVHPLLEHQWENAGYRKGDCPIAEAVSSQIVTLPIYPGIGRKEVDRTFRFLTKMKNRGVI